MPTPPVLRGPQVGAPPSLEQIAIDRLQVDPAYQRAADSPQSRRLISRMIRRWNWALCQPLVVARRDDRSLWILDGQHRVAGARERGDIVHLPCVVLAEVAQTEEADTFLGLNTERQKLSEADKFNAMLAAGHADAQAVAQLLSATGWRVRKSSNTAIFKPGDLTCAPMLVRMVRTRGATIVEFALLVLRAAYPDRPVRQTAQLLDAIMLLAEREDCEAADLARTLATREPGDWCIARDVAVRERGLKRADAAWRVLADALAANRAAGSAASPTAAAPPPTSSPPSPQTPRTTSWRSPLPGDAPTVVPTAKLGAVGANELFGVSGKGFCSQCDRLVSPGSVAGCADKFCQMKAVA